jgi:hypothetical protein
MTEQRKRLLIAAAVVLGAAGGGYYAGAASARSAVRSIETAQDLLVPADDMRRTRVRREAIREMLKGLARSQEEALVNRGAYLTAQELAFDRGAFILESGENDRCSWRPDGCATVVRWMGVGRHVASPIGEVCAVALNVEPAYLSGIPLRRMGRVRCSWDLATKLNLLFQ